MKKKLFCKINLNYTDYIKIDESNDYIFLGEDGLYHLKLPITYYESEKIKPIMKKKYNSYIKITDNNYAFTTSNIYRDGVNLLHFYDLRNDKFTNEIIGYPFTTFTNGLYLIDLSEKYKILLCACEAHRNNEKNGILIQKIINKFED